MAISSVDGLGEFAIHLLGCGYDPVLVEVDSGGGSDTGGSDTSGGSDTGGGTCTGASSQTCGNCGTQSRTCTNGAWGAWSSCSGGGVCASGTTQSCTGGTQICTSACAWGTCNQTTAGMASVPGGTMTLGASDQSNNLPHSVAVATFLMDLTEVTVSAYGSCVTAAQCTTPSTCDYGTPNWGVSGKENHPINCVSWTDANIYCTWASKCHAMRLKLCDGVAVGSLRPQGPCTA